MGKEKRNLFSLKAVWNFTTQTPSALPFTPTISRKNKSSFTSKQCCSIMSVITVACLWDVTRILIAVYWVCIVPLAYQSLHQLLLTEQSVVVLWGDRSLLTAFLALKSSKGLQGEREVRGRLMSQTLTHSHWDAAGRKGGGEEPEWNRKFLIQASLETEQETGTGRTEWGSI